MRQKIYQITLRVYKEKRNKSPELITKKDCVYVGSKNKNKVRRHLEYYISTFKFETQCSGFYGYVAMFEPLVNKYDGTLHSYPDNGKYIFKLEKDRSEA